MTVLSRPNTTLSPIRSVPSWHADAVVVADVHPPAEHQPAVAAAAAASPPGGRGTRSPSVDDVRVAQPEPQEPPVAHQVERASRPGGGRPSAGCPAHEAARTWRGSAPGSPRLGAGDADVVEQPLPARTLPRAPVERPTAAATTGRRTSPSACRAGPGCTAASKVRTGQPNHAAVSSSVTVRTSTAPARSAVRGQLVGVEGVEVDDGLQRRRPGRLVELLGAAAPTGRAAAAGWVTVRGRRPGEPAEPAGVRVAARGSARRRTRTGHPVEHPQHLAQRRARRRGCGAAPRGRRRGRTCRRRTAAPRRRRPGPRPSKPELLGVAAGRLDHARRQVGDVHLAGTPAC